MKTAISLPDKLFQEADRVAERLGLSRSELYRKALETYIEGQRVMFVRETLDRVYSAGGERGGLDPGIARLQEESISPESWEDEGW